MIADGYPTDAQLATVREWPYGDYRGLMAYVHSLWWAADWGFSLTVEDGEPLSFREGEPGYYLSTGAWSGNESVIAALQENQMFWALCWQESRRGGHYKFVVPREAEHD